MKYLIAAADPHLDAEVHKRFGHAPFWLVVDSETKDFTVIEGAGEDHPRHGIDRIAGMGVSRAIVGNIGPHAFDNLKAVGIAMFSCRHSNVREALEKVERGEVAELTEATMKVSVQDGQGGEGHHHHHDHEHGEHNGEHHGKLDDHEHGEHHGKPDDHEREHSEHQQHVEDRHHH